ncbi:MbeD/MobD family mobilization/exclusion protein [Pectobacterium sp. B2J-2]|uniref:MbeD/MobD family mobilization/exclusion protein n=1 Tax=Pectobacterium sp. B2J-2 TaxID=3385372 RepID=UPI0038FC50C3
MRLEELEYRLDSALRALEQSVQRQQQTWRQEYQSLQQQLVQAKERDAYLCSQIERLSAQLNAVDSSPERNPLIQKMKAIHAHLDALAQEASAFRRSLR